MNIFGIGLPEMAVIAAIALLVFGPKRLPEMGKTLGRTLRGFQTASQEFEQEFRSAIRTEESAVSLPPTSPESSPEPVDQSSGMPPSGVALTSAESITPPLVASDLVPVDGASPSLARDVEITAPSSPPSS